MTNLAICKKCRALTPDTADDIGEHRRKHNEQDADIERARKAASDATSALKQLQAVVKGYEQALDQREVPVEPEINLRVVDDAETADIDAEVAEGETEEPTSEAYEDAVAAFTTPPTTGTTQQVYDPVTGLYVAVQP